MKLYFTILLFIGVTVVCRGQSNPAVDIYSLQVCDQLAASARTPAEKVELQKDYWILLGVVSELGAYRDAYIRSHKPIDIFPTAYYHTTMSEMQRIAALSFKDPIEKMKQMIAFYDAYKFNRRNWDAGDKTLVEPHWREHFEKSESTLLAKQLSACLLFGYALNSAIRAHVQGDLQRAVSYAADHRFNRSISKDGYRTAMLAEFISTNDIFGSTMKKTIDDIVYANKFICLSIAYKPLLNHGQWVIQKLNSAGEVYNSMETEDLPENSIWKKLMPDRLDRILAEDDIIPFRIAAWYNAFKNVPFKDAAGNVLKAQPLTDHDQLMNIGESICPAIDTPKAAPREPEKPAAPAAAVAVDLSGSSPEALGRLMLRAVKTNDAKLWNSCIHPVVDDPSKVIASLERVRERLAEGGVTDWSSLIFSRVTFSIDGYSFGKSDHGIYQGGIKPNDGQFKGESIRRTFRIEFTYRNKEFVGWIGDIPIMTYHHKSYLMLNPSTAIITRY